MFELELSARKIAKQLELPYKTVFKAVMVIRYAILVHAAEAWRLSCLANLNWKNLTSEKSAKEIEVVVQRERFPFSAFCLAAAGLMSK